MGGLGARPAYRFALGGGDRIRTDDRLVANQVLYQLSYAPIWVVPAWEGLSAGPSIYSLDNSEPG